MMVRLAICLVLALAAFAFSPRPATAQNAPARVYILDASNSMSNYMDPHRDLRARIFVAKDQLRDLLANDTGRTAAVFAFGSKSSWKRDLEPRWRTPGNVPASDDACMDIERISDFGRVDDVYRNRVERRLRSINPKGMTPITNALTNALDALKPYGGGEIVLISDYEAPNCQPRGRTICQDIVQYAGEIQIDLRSVQVRLYNIPKSNLGRDLRDCFEIAPPEPSLPSQPAPGRPGIPSPAPAPVSPGPGSPPPAASVTIETIPVFSPRPLGQRPPSLTALTQTVTDITTGRQVSRGPVNAIRVPPGNYRVSLTNAFGHWNSTGQFQTDRQIRVPIAPGAVVVRALDAATLAPLQAPVDLTVYRIDPNQQPTALPAVTLQPGGGRLLLGEGRFLLTVDPANAPRLEVPVELGAGQVRTVALPIPTQPTQRDVRVSVETLRPTLIPARFTAPAVSLRSGTRTLRPLPEGSTTLSLQPGDYQVVVDARPQHVLPFSVTPGAGRLRVAVQVTPGWFVATGSSPGIYRLRDGTGKALGEFDLSRATTIAIGHSLPDGRYELERQGDTQAPFRHGFIIRLGQQTDIRLP